jgi:hypothetical protein
MKQGKKEPYYCDNFRDNACFSNLTGSIRQAVEHGATHMDGWYHPNKNLNVNLIDEYVELCIKELPSDVDFMYDGKIVHYYVPIAHSMNFKLLYFTVCFPRFLLEYHGSINMTMKLIKEEGMNFFLAHILAFHYQRNKRWLHLPWTTEYVSDDDNLKKLVRHAKALCSFSKEDMYGEFYSSFKSSGHVDVIAEEEREIDIDCNTMSAIKQMNRYVEG